MASHKAILPEPSKIPSAKPAFCFQWACEMHSNCIVVLQTDQFVKQMVLCSHWLLQAFTNEFFVVYWWHYRLFVLSIIMPPLPSLSPQLQFSSCFSHILSENTLITNPPLPHFPSTSETIKSSNLHTFKSHEWKRTLVLLLMLLSHSPKNFLFFFFCLTLSLLPASVCGLVRQLCSVGRVSESDLTSAVLLLSWLVWLTLGASGCESYVKYGAITFFPSNV